MNGITKMIKDEMKEDNYLLPNRSVNKARRKRDTLIDEIYDRDYAGDYAVASILMSQLIRIYVEQFDTDNLNEIFDLIQYQYADGEIVSSWVLISLLRSSFMFKSEIFYWDKMIEVAIKQLKIEGLDVKKELYGLL